MPLWEEKPSFKRSLVRLFHWFPQCGNVSIEPKRTSDIKASKYQRRLILNRKCVSLFKTIPSEEVL